MICIENLLTAYGVKAEEVQGYRTILCSLILQKAPELRKFKRLINSAFSMTFCDDNILDKRDLLGLEVIGFFDRELYEEIHRHPKFFVSHDKYTDWRAFDLGSQREKLNQKGPEYFQKLFAKYSAYEELLQEMFPYVRKYKNRVELVSAYEGEDTDADEIARQARICSGKYFDLYFSYGSNQYLRIKKAVEAYIQQINKVADGDAVRKTVLDMLEVSAQEEQVEWIERFENYLGQISEPRKLDVAKVLMDNTYRINDELGFLRLNSRARAEVIIAELLMQCPKTNFGEYMDSIAHRYEFIHNISSVLRWMQSGSRRFSVNDLEERTKKVQAVFNTLCQEIVEQRISLYEDTYYRPGNIWALYHHLEKADRTVFVFRSPYLSFRLFRFTLSQPILELPLAFFTFVVGENVGEDAPGDILDFVLRNTGIVDELLFAAQAGCSLRFNMKFLRYSCGRADDLLRMTWLPS